MKKCVVTLSAAFFSIFLFSACADTPTEPEDEYPEEVAIESEDPAPEVLVITEE